MSLSDYYQQIGKLGGIAKPEPRRKTKAREDRKADQERQTVRAYVFGRERNVCRCCRCRPAQSMHEIKPKGAGGKESKKNSIAVCGQLVGTEPSCHTYLQKHEISVGHSVLGAEAELIFTMESKAAAEWCKVAVGAQIVSPVMQTTEIAAL